MCAVGDCYVIAKVTETISIGSMRVGIYQVANVSLFLCSHTVFFLKGDTIKLLISQNISISKNRAAAA